MFDKLNHFLKARSLNLTYIENRGQTYALYPQALPRLFGFVIIIIFLLSLGCVSFRKPLRIEGYSGESKLYSQEELINKIKTAEPLKTFQLMGRLKYRSGYLRGIRYVKILLIGEDEEKLRIQAFRNVLTLFDLFVQGETFDLYLKKDGILISDSLSALKKQGKLRFLYSLIDIDNVLIPLALIRDCEIKKLSENKREYIVEVDNGSKHYVYKVQKEDLIVSELNITDEDNDTAYEIDFRQYKQINNVIIPMSFLIIQGPPFILHIMLNTFILFRLLQSFAGFFYKRFRGIAIFGEYGISYTNCNFPKGLSMTVGK